MACGDECLQTRREIVVNGPGATSGSEARAHAPFPHGWMGSFRNGPEPSQGADAAQRTLDGEDRCERVSGAEGGVRTLPRVGPRRTAARKRRRAGEAARCERGGARGTACATASGRE